MNAISLCALASKLDIPLKHSATGKVISLRGPLLVARLPDIAIGDLCYVSRRNRSPLWAQAISFENDLCLLAPFDDLEGISPQTEVTTKSESLGIQVSQDLIGKVIDPMGKVLNCNDAVQEVSEIGTRMPLNAASPNPLQRKPIKEKLHSGIKSIDLFCPLGYGQRVGLFAGPGAGKSTLIGMLARNAEVDLSVIALVGERGREVNDFINESLGSEGLKKSILVVSTSDESPLRRVMAAQSATAIAEYFRAQGMKVLLLVDSLTRVARAIRDVTLAAGELPLRQGFTPSVYAQLPRLLERTGTSERGSITAIYSLLTQNDEANDALGEEVKSILDGHIVLNAGLANEGIRPALDILSSISRLFENLHTESEKASCRILLRIAQRLRKDKDIVLLGGQADRELQVALELEDSIAKLLSQKPIENYRTQDAFEEMNRIIEQFQTRMRT